MWPAHFCYFDSGLYIPQNGKIDFVRWRLITLGVSTYEWDRANG